MLRVAGFAVFLIVSSALVGLTHFYFWTRLVAPLVAAAPWRALATWLLVALAVLLPAGAVAARLFAGSAAWLAWPAFTWMGLVFLLLVCLGAADLVRLALMAGARLAAFSASADAWGGLPAWLGGAAYWRAASPLALGVALVAALFGIGAARGVPAVKAVDIELPRLPAALDGLKVVQLTDLHLGETLGAPWLRGVIGRTNELRPDLVVITGDLVDGTVTQLGNTVAELQRLAPPRYGVFFVTGNHEYYSGVEEWVRELPRLGIRVLRNERVAVGEGAASFELAGVDDASAHIGGVRGDADVARALAGYDGQRALVLLSHQPKTIAEAAAGGVGLQISGHTHGGQIWPWGYLVGLTQPFVRGLARHGAAQIYVSNGTGYWGPPMRIGAPAEITVFTLRSPPGQ